MSPLVNAEGLAIAGRLETSSLELRAGELVGLIAEAVAAMYASRYSGGVRRDSDSETTPGFARREHGASGLSRIRRAGWKQQGRLEGLRA